MGAGGKLGGSMRKIHIFGIGNGRLHRVSHAGRCGDALHQADDSRMLNDELRCCPYHKSDPDVLMMESTEYRPHLKTAVALNGPSIGRILP